MLIHALCTTALDLRRSVWETSKRLKGALEHVEDIEDEDEPRILREPMEELQKLVREGLTSKTMGFSLYCKSTIPHFDVPDLTAFSRIQLPLIQKQERCCRATERSQEQRHQQYQPQDQTAHGRSLSQWGVVAHPGRDQER